MRRMFSENQIKEFIKQAIQEKESQNKFCLISGTFYDGDIDYGIQGVIKKPQGVDNSIYVHLYNSKLLEIQLKETPVAILDDDILENWSATIELYDLFTNELIASVDM